MQEATSLLDRILGRWSFDLGHDLEVDDVDIERDLRHGRTELPPRAVKAVVERRVRYFVVLYEPGRSWRTGRPPREQPLGEHLAYMTALRDGGRLMLGGPFGDGAGGLIVLRAADLGAATAMVEEDPSVVTGVLSATVHPWHAGAPAAVGNDFGGVVE